MPRRRTPAIATALLALAIGVAGCGGDGAGGLDGAAATAPSGSGVLRWVLAERPTTLDPLYAATAADRLAARQLHEPLVETLNAPFGAPRSSTGLARSVQPSGDATVWRVLLRSGVRFGDGAPFNATAVLANVARWQATPQGRAVLGDFLVDAPSPEMVRFILPAPDPNFDSRLASPRLGIVSPKALAEAAGGELEPSRAPDSGTGPFELRERSADRLLLARNTEWWGASRGLGPGVDQLELTVEPDAAQRLAELRDGSAEVAELDRDQLAAVRRDPLLTTLPDAAGGIGIERSVRGIPSEPVPALSGAWLTTLGAG
jgi:peptide/nickel transport system substrate-binding protein